MGVDGLYFRVSSDRQTTENQFEGLLLIAEKDGSTRDWDPAVTLTLRLRGRIVLLKRRRPDRLSC